MRRSDMGGGGGGCCCCPPGKNAYQDVVSHQPESGHRPAPRSLPMRRGDATDDDHEGPPPQHHEDVRAVAWLRQRSGEASKSQQHHPPPLARKEAFSPGNSQAAPQDRPTQKVSTSTGPLELSPSMTKAWQQHRIPGEVSHHDHQSNHDIQQPLTMHLQQQQPRPGQPSFGEKKISVLDRDNISETHVLDDDDDDNDNLDDSEDDIMVGGGLDGDDEDDLDERILDEESELEVRIIHHPYDDDAPSLPNTAPLNTTPPRDRDEDPLSRQRPGPDEEETLQPTGSGSQSTPSSAVASATAALKSSPSTTTTTTTTNRPALHISPTLDPAEMAELDALVARLEQQAQESFSESSPERPRAAPAPASVSPLAPSPKDSPSFRVRKTGEDGLVQASPFRVIGISDSAVKNLGIPPPMLDPSVPNASGKKLDRPGRASSLRAEPSPRDSNPVYPEEDDRWPALASSRSLDSSYLKRKIESTVAATRSNTGMITPQELILPQTAQPSGAMTGRRESSVLFSPPSFFSSDPPAAGPDPNSESLSDIPSNVDPQVRERYLEACRLLKTALIEREHRLLPTERSFLQGLLNDTDVGAPSEAQVSVIESVSHTLLSDPFFSVGSVHSSAFDDSDLNPASHGPSSPNNSRLSDKTRKILNRVVQPVDLDVGRYVDVDDDFDDSDDEDEKKSAVSITPLRRVDGDDIPFLILGNDKVRHNVLTPSVMEALRGFFPISISEENFWLKYSLERDGASLSTLLKQVGSSKHTILSVETKEGYVFGAFCSSPWRIQSKWFGSNECFLWRLKNSRFVAGETKRRVDDYNNDMEIYPCTGHDEYIQYCTKKTIAVGGGDWNDQHWSPYREEEPAGIGLMIDGDLEGGETNSCATFANPRLCSRLTRSNEFNISNLEVWTVTPCTTVEEAGKLEVRRMFIEEHMRRMK